MLPVDRLVPYIRNARTHSEDQIAQIAASIAEFGFRQPIVVDEKMVVIVGHTRLEAAKDAGEAFLDEVPDRVRVGGVVFPKMLARFDAWAFNNGPDKKPGTADDLKLDRDPRVVQQLEAVRREVLARAYVEKVGEAAAKPTPEEIKKYYDEKPALFSDRRRSRAGARPRRPPRRQNWRG